MIVKQTVSKGIRYQYWYVKHVIDGKIKWCYIGKILPVEYQKLKPNRGSTQTGTQNSTQTENPDLNPISDNVAPPIGLEPMTDWLTASRSTGLSYGGMF